MMIIIAMVMIKMEKNIELHMMADIRINHDENN